MTETEWKQSFAMELARLQSPIQPEQLPTVSHTFWLSSSGVAPEPIAAAVAEAWPERLLSLPDSLLSSARRQVLETREVLRRLNKARATYELRLLDSVASVCRDHCQTAVDPEDGFEAIIGPLEEPLPRSMGQAMAQSPSVMPI